MFVKNDGDCPQVTISVPLPVSARAIVTQHPVRLSYILELYWRSIYEKGYAKSVLPFYLLLDRSGDAKIRMRMLKIDWAADID